MHGSRSKFIQRCVARTPIAAAILLACPAAMAQEKAALEEVMVTAQKRTENLQDVPISIQALGSQSLEELHLKNFRDYVQMLPTVAVQPSVGAGSGFSLVYMRGIASGGDGQATTSQPSVGMYLDEQPITTVQGNLDIHMYDIARVEALAGPQGTLYGASSQAGTIRIITNKPDLSGFSAGYSLTGNMVDSSSEGYVAEGFVNLPIGEKAAIRLVGWSESDAGWIDNKHATRTFPGVLSDPLDDITIDNAAFAKDNYNTQDTYGGRAALRVELNDNWTVTPAVQYQRQESKGAWGDDLSDLVVSGNQDVSHFQKEFTNDEWYQVGLTIEGKIGNFDLVYSGNYLNRQVDGSFDYSDYSYWYDTTYTTGYFADLHFADTGPRSSPNQFVPAYFDSADVGTRIMNGDYFTNDDGYTKKSHELRISSAQDKRVRGMLGFFWQEQQHQFRQFFKMNGLGTVMLMNGGTDPRFADTVYLNSMDRTDKDKAVFASVSIDLNDQFELTLGERFFEPTVDIVGFFGFGLGFTPIWSSNGENRCNLFPEGQADFRDAPCKNVDKGISENGHVGRVNLTYKKSDSSILYATWSEGYRPGGINRNPFAGNFKSDFLTNWEFGWKTQWLDNTLQFNGALFHEDWKNFQVSFQGANGITQVGNGPSAEINGTELQLLWSATDKLRISASAAYYDTKLSDDYADFDANGNVTGIQAPRGTQLPVTPDFKANLVSRYSFNLGNFDAHVQSAFVYVGHSTSDLNVQDAAIKGEIPSYKTVDISAGIAKDSYSVELFIKNVGDEDAYIFLTSECATSVCGGQNYGVRLQPRTVGIKFTQDF